MLLSSKLMEKSYIDMISRIEYVFWAKLQQFDHVPPHCGLWFLHRYIQLLLVSWDSCSAHGEHIFWRHDSDNPLPCAGVMHAQISPSLQDASLYVWQIHQVLEHDFQFAPKKMDLRHALTEAFEGNVVSEANPWECCLRHVLIIIMGIDIQVFFPIDSGSSWKWERCTFNQEE